MTQKTSSATILATATLFVRLTQILLGPIAGTVVDRDNRRAVMIAAGAVIAAFTLLLACLFWTGSVETWHMFMIMTVRSVGSAFHFPTMSASTLLVVPEQHLSRVAGANQILFGLVSIVAPPARGEWHVCQIKTS